MQIVVQSNRIVEYDDVTKVVLAGQNGGVAPGRSSHDGGRCVLGVMAIVENVVEVEYQCLAWAVVVVADSWADGGCG